MASDAELVQYLYDRFNARDIDGVLTALAENVAWANGMDGGHVYGHEAVRDYWTRQWAVIDPHVEPIQVGEPADRSTLVDVHQVVKDLATRFDIESASGLSTLSH